MTRLLALIGTVALAAVLIMFSTSPGQQAQEAQATSRAVEHKLATGDILSPDQVEFIDHPGRYGLGTQLRGSRYAIVGDHLVRIDPATMQVLSILRSHVETRQ